MSLPFEIEKNQNLILAEIQKAGAELVDLTFRRFGGRHVLTATVDKHGGVTLEDCTQINRGLSDLLDKLTQEGSGDPLLQSPYDLEVVSPGLDRPLKTERDFLKAIGDIVRVTFKRQDGQDATWTGKITAAGASGVEMELKDGAKKIITLDQVLHAERRIEIKGKG